MVGGAEANGWVIAVSPPCGTGSCGRPHDRQNLSLSLTRAAPHSVQKPMLVPLLREHPTRSVRGTLIRRGRRGTAIGATASGGEGED